MRHFLTMLGLLWAAPVQAVDLGGDVSTGIVKIIGDSAGVLDPGLHIKTSFLFHMKAFSVGPVLSTMHFNGMFYEEQSAAGLFYNNGDCYMLGAGGAFSMNIKVSQRLHLAPRAEFQIQNYVSPMDGVYYIEEVESKVYGGVQPMLGLQELLYSSTGGVDLRLPAAGSASFIIGMDAGYITKMGLIAGGRVGVHVGR